MAPEFKLEVSRFAVVGALNFGLTFLVFFVLVKLLQVNHLLSLLAAWLLGMLFSYVLNFSWVFKPEKELAFKVRFGKYTAASVVSIALNLLALHYLVALSGFDPFYVQCALIPLIVIFNFSTAKYWSLRRENES